METSTQSKSKETEKNQGDRSTQAGSFASCKSILYNLSFINNFIVQICKFTKLFFILLFLFLASTQPNSKMA